MSENLDNINKLHKNEVYSSSEYKELVRSGINANPATILCELLHEFRCLGFYEVSKVSNKTKVIGYIYELKHLIPLVRTSKLIMSVRVSIYVGSMNNIVVSIRDKYNNIHRESLSLFHVKENLNQNSCEELIKHTLSQLYDASAYKNGYQIGFTFSSIFWSKGYQVIRNDQNV